MELPRDKYLILYDGECNLCHSVVQKIIVYDNKDVFRFLAQNSEKGQIVCQSHGVKNTLESIILISPTGIKLEKSAAVFAIAAQLPKRFLWIQCFRIFPKSLCDRLYDYIARKRYFWFGKSASCLLPTPEIKYRFL
jgi:predicted DCC family thiol-disulfide oxidoreductase YuxK